VSSLSLVNIIYVMLEVVLFQWSYVKISFQRILSPSLLWYLDLRTKVDIPFYGIWTWEPGLAYPAVNCLYCTSSSEYIGNCGFAICFSSLYMDGKVQNNLILIYMSGYSKIGVLRFVFLHYRWRKKSKIIPYLFICQGLGVGERGSDIRSDHILIYMAGFRGGWFWRKNSSM